MIIFSYVECGMSFALTSLLIKRTCTPECFVLLQAKDLSEFFEVCQGLEFGSGQMYIKIDDVSF